MKQIYGDLWDQDGYKLIPTNLTVNKMGQAVLGRGVALQAVEKYPDLPALYGRVLKWGSGANNVMIHATRKLILAPVKRHWREKADLTLIRNSLRTILALLDDGSAVFLPLLGCGYGELAPEDVMPILEDLDDRFTLVLRSDEVQKKYPASFKPGARKDKSLSLPF